jgi:DNA mismatch endonuclease (patch repair protein)
MRAVRSRDTAPELAVRKMLRSLGFIGYRLHRKELPGKPDVAFLKRRKAIFIHGCFWHGHDCPRGSRKPSTNVGYWLPKIERNRQRDTECVAALNQLGWSSLTVWECELRDSGALAAKLTSFLL